jgi:hypothetical protein
MDEKLLSALAALAGRVDAIQTALIKKGVISLEEIKSNYPKTEAEEIEIYNRYFAPFFGSR